MCRSVLDGMEDAVFIFDLENRLLYMNRAAETLTGQRIGNSLGGSYKEIFEDIDRDGRLNDALKHKDLPNLGSFGSGDLAFQFFTSPIQEGDELSGVSVLLRKPLDLSSKDRKDSKEEKDISVRSREDAASCNDAESELRRRDRILAGAVLAINQLLIVEEKEAAINQALEILGCSADVDRVYIFENMAANNGERMHRLRYEWTRDTVESQMKDARFHQISYEPLPHWYEALSSGRPIRGLTRELPDEIRKFLQSLNVLSYLIVPVFMEGRFWGFIGFDDCRSERSWTWCEASILLTIAGALGGALGRWQADADLRESEGKYRELVESSNSIIMRRNPAGNITFFNEFAQKFFGTPGRDPGKSSGDNSPLSTPRGKIQDD
jgi:PAS domain-containing protein